MTGDDNETMNTESESHLDWFDGEIDSVEIRDASLSKEEIDAAYRLSNGTIPDECPYCHDPEMLWRVALRKYKNGSVEGRVTCVNCDRNIVEEIAFNPNHLVPDSLPDTDIYG